MTKSLKTKFTKEEIQQAKEDGMEELIKYLVKKGELKK